MRTKGKFRESVLVAELGGRRYIFLVSCGDSTPRLPQSSSEVGG